jgi:hypothetical protein
VINNFTAGTNDPEVIDSVSLVAFRPRAKTVAEPAVARTPKPGMVAVPARREIKKIRNRNRKK